MAALRTSFHKASCFFRPITRFYSSAFGEEPAVDKDIPIIEKSINQVLLLGRVGIDPQSRGTESNPVTIFSMATNTTYKDENGDFKQKTEWHRVSIFKPHLRDNVFNFLKKGQRCLVQGKISYGQVTDKIGAYHATTSIVADDVILFPKASGMEARQGAYLAE